MTEYPPFWYCPAIVIPELLSRTYVLSAVVFGRRRAIHGGIRLVLWTRTSSSSMVRIDCVLEQGLFGLRAPSGAEHGWFRLETGDFERKNPDWACVLLEHAFDRAHEIMGDPIVETQGK